LHRGKQIRDILLEGLVVAVAGAILAFAANTLSPRGINLNKDWFGLERPPVTPTTNPQPAVISTTVTNSATTNSPDALLEAQLKAIGVQLVDSNQVVQLFRDPRRDQQLIVFVDARDEDHYHQGHIPGALEFFPYYPDKYMAEVWPICQIAERIIVYCNGGTCDDSVVAVRSLRDLPGISTNKLSVYGGGFAEWTTNSLPVETGERNSGQFLPQKK
jgi:rhodanese-related sulfurtransferase